MRPSAQASGLGLSPASSGSGVRFGGRTVMAGAIRQAAWGTLFVVAVPIATAEVVDAFEMSPTTAQRLAAIIPPALAGLALIAATVAARGDIGDVVRRLWTRSTGPVARGRRQRPAVPEESLIPMEGWC